MAGVTKVNGFTTPDQFLGRDIVGITIGGLAACPALVDGELVEWPELELAVRAIEQFATISVVGAFTATDTGLNMIIEGVASNGDQYVLADGTTPATIFEKLAEEIDLVVAGTGTCVEFAI